MRKLDPHAVWSRKKVIGSNNASRRSLDFLATKKAKRKANEKYVSRMMARIHKAGCQK